MSDLQATRRDVQILQAALHEFPDLEINTIRKYSGMYYQIEYRNGRQGYDLIRLDILRPMLRYLNMKRRLEEALEAAYPFLSFAIWNTPWKTEYQDRRYGFPWDADAPTTVYLKGEGGLPLRVFAGYEFNWPLTKAVKEELQRINDQAEWARKPGWFYCTSCRTAKPLSEKGGFYIAEHRCTDCANPDWLDQLEREWRLEPWEVREA